MSKSNRNSQSRPQAEPRLPRGHFDKEGLSQGTRNGEGRSRHDAYNTDVKDGDKGLKDASEH